MSNRKLSACRLHAQWLGERGGRVRGTGGASACNLLRQILADVFQAEIDSISVTSSVALGAALKDDFFCCCGYAFSSQMIWPVSLNRLGKRSVKSQVKNVEVVSVQYHEAESRKINGESVFMLYARTDSSGEDLTL